jgi:hypothetical protein
MVQAIGSLTIVNGPDNDIALSNSTMVVMF